MNCCPCEATWGVYDSEGGYRFWPDGAANKFLDFEALTDRLEVLRTRMSRGDGC